MSDVDATVSTLLQKEEFLDAYESAIDFTEEGGTENPWKSGFNYSDVSGTPQVLSMMAQEGLLDMDRHSSRPNMYSIPNLDLAKEALNIIQDGNISDKQTKDEDREIPDIPEDLFDNIIGHEPVKQLFTRALNIEDQTHFRLQGKSSTAKSLFLTEIERLPNAKYRSASGMSEAGILDILIEQQPQYLLFDEIDKADNSCYTPLYELTEHGRIQKTISGQDINIELNCNLIVTLNHPQRLPQELKNRMVRLDFEEYSDDEYIEVVTGVLQDEYNLDKEVAAFIAEYQLEELGVKNVREPEQIAKLANNSIDDVKQVIKNIEKYRT